MSRILGIDYGERRIGLAVTDPTRTIASPLATLVRRLGKRPPWAELLEVVREQEVTEVVIGLPLALSGDEDEWAAEVRAFGDQVAKRTGLPIHWVDERLSSVMAEQAVRSMGLRKSQREEKERVDAAAAAIVLRAFLARQSREAEEREG